MNDELQKLLTLSKRINGLECEIAALRKNTQDLDARLRKVETFDRLIRAQIDAGQALAIH